MNPDSGGERGMRMDAGTRQEDPLRRAIEDHLSMRVAAGGDMPLGRFILEHGVTHPGTAFKGRRRPAKQCFRNAYELAQVKGFRYAEGYALSGSLLASGLALPVEHAWCVDADGNAVDPTWSSPETSFYLGVEFDPAAVWRRIAEKGTHGMFFTGRGGGVDAAYLGMFAEELGAGGHSLAPPR